MTEQVFPKLKQETGAQLNIGDWKVTSWSLEFVDNAVL